MGGTGFRIEIERTAEDALSLEEVHAQVWGYLAETLEQVLEYDDARSVLVGYLPIEVERLNCEDRGQRWEQSDTELWFMFGDGHGGNRRTYRAMFHWGTLIHAAEWQSWTLRGWRVGPPRSDVRRKLVVGPLDPLVYVDGDLMAVDRRERGRAPEELAAWSDSTQLRWDQLGADRDRLEWAALTNECRCDVCGFYRERDVPEWDAKGFTHVEAARSAWAQLEAGAHAEREAAAYAAIMAWDWTQWGGPDELRVLAEALGVAAMPPAALAGLVIRHAPDE